MLDTPRYYRPCGPAEAKWSQSAGTSGHFPPEPVVFFPRNRSSFSPGTRGRFQPDCSLRGDLACACIGHAYALPYSTRSRPVALEVVLEERPLRRSGRPFCAPEAACNSATSRSRADMHSSDETGARTTGRQIRIFRSGAPLESVGRWVLLAPASACDIRSGQVTQIWSRPGRSGCCS